MKKLIINILAVIAGLLLGSIVNMILINMNGSVISLPEGADISNAEKLKAAIPLFKPIHFLAPFLGHAIGTLVGAFVTALIARSHKLKFALLIGLLFLIGGIMNIFMIGGPVWFYFVDLILAYIPMAWFGYLIARKIRI